MKQQDGSTKDVLRQLGGVVEGQKTGKPAETRREKRAEPTVSVVRKLGERIV